MFQKIYQKYVELILDAKPGRTWKIVRGVLHWLTLFPKLAIIGSLGLFQIIRQSRLKNRPVPALPSAELKNEMLQKVLYGLPVYKKDGLELHVNRSPLFEGVQGWNHNFDHQASRHGTYAFLMGRVGLRNIGIDVALTKHMSKTGQLARGYKLNPFDGQYDYNFATVSGDMLVGVTLGMLNLRSEQVKENEFDSSIGFLKEYYDIMLHTLIENDYSLLEGLRPEDGDINQALWDKYEEYNKKAMPSQQKKMKSLRGMWQPGLETVGAQALTVLAALRVGDKVIGASYAKKEYRKLLWHYGYGLLSLFPTAFTKNRRGYFNDHNCIVALYVLSKLSDSRMGRLFWKLAMKYVWALSKPWYNAYFTGLLEDAHPGTVDPKYLETCMAYLYDTPKESLNVSFDGSAEVEPKEFPVKFNEMNQDEFYPDMPQKLLLPPDITEQQKYDVMRGITRYRSGLGWFASAVMLEKELKLQPKDK